MIAIPLPSIPSFIYKDINFVGNIYILYCITNREIIKFGNLLFLNKN
ncbi:hypothetical protein BCE_1014 [Bacillus cereus ATCC 10987]|uniref:Uncharacterized protein n=1 Tax=Bacillus cereus (strain ATCC 10987 / NRS 248) TaxID=222523 RepID=Q73CQ0_BACC1|nr:hypothetical protein BCE_1014 [Bacillus cereus ATCC 10987]